MKTNPLYRNVTFMILLLACLVFCSAGPVWAANYNSLVTKAREQLQDDRFIEALATARDAVRANAKDYKGHYYVAMACMGMGQFDDAIAAVNRARELAPQNAKPAVEKLAGAITASRQGTDKGKAADAALAEGLAGKAARLYEEAWNAGQSNPELGLKAADLYANRLSQPVDAARVLRQVSSAAKESPAAERANSELTKLAGTLRPLAEGHVIAARQKQGVEALQSLQLAEAADPSYIKIYELRAQLAAQGDSIEALQNAIKVLAKRDLAQPQQLASLPRMTQWLQQPAFNEFLTDLLGDGQIDQVRKLAKDAGKPLDTIPGFINVPAGCFETNGKQVCLDAFRIGKYEVTQGEYKRVMGSNPAGNSSCGDNCPVENVSWYDAQAFISRLNSQTGRLYRLPTEAEWEYACRGAGSNQKYCGGDNIDAVAWYKGNSMLTNNRVYYKTYPGGQKQPNGLGIYDMSGNVREWIQDWHGSNYPSSGSNPTGASTGSSRVIRGGSSDHDEIWARSDRRFEMKPDLQYQSTGFRLVAPVP